jgi:hypothetical protein
MVNRYGHITNKTRDLSKVLKKSGDDVEGHLHEQLHIFFRRAKRLRMAIFLACVSLLCAAVLISTLFLMSLLQPEGVEGAVVIAVLFIGCMLALSASLIVFLTDINMSLQALSLEFESHSKFIGETSSSDKNDEHAEGALSD